MSLGAVGIPVVGLPSWELMRSIVGLKSPGGFAYFTVGEYRRPKPIDAARNELAQMFLENEHLEWLLFVDSDAVLHPLTLNRLLSWDVPIVSALCFVRVLPTVPAFWELEKTADGREKVQMQPTMDFMAQHPELLTGGATILHDAPKDALKESGFVGMHTTLIRREVIEKMQPPYFVSNYKGAGEDVFFCEKARRFGFKSYVDLSVVSGHQMQHQLSGLDFQMSVLWMQQQQEFLK